jgi:hypothetical protein
LQGDDGAQRFLEQACQIYVLDVAGTTTTTTTTTSTAALMEYTIDDHSQHSQPSLYGC